MLAAEREPSERARPFARRRLDQDQRTHQPAEGLPIGLVITPGQAHDVTAFHRDPEQLLGDKGYDSEAVRQEIEDHGGSCRSAKSANKNEINGRHSAKIILLLNVARVLSTKPNNSQVLTCH
jgi:IS5 family transposase